MNVFPFILKYNPNNPNLLQLIRKTFEILQQGTIKMLIGKFRTIALFAKINIMLR